MKMVFAGAFGLKELRIEPSYVAPYSAWIAVGGKGVTAEGDGIAGGSGVHLDHAATVRLYHAIGEILMGEETA